MALATNFKDDVLADSEQRRRYRIIEYDDGTISLEDVTEYSQTGSKFGALEVNQERQAINDLDVNKINYTDVVNALTSTATNKPLSAAQGKSLSDRVGSLSSLTTSVKTSIVNAINSLMSGKVNFTDIVNNLTTTASGKALDARQGKSLNDKISSINYALSVTASTVSLGTDVTVGSQNLVRKSGNIVQMSVGVINKYGWDAGRSLYIGHVPGGYRPSTERASYSISKNKVAFSFSIYTDGSVNIWPNEALQIGDNIYIDTTWVI